MYSTVRWVIDAGETAVAAVQGLERAGAKVTASGLRSALDNVVVPADHQELAREMGNEGFKATMVRLRTVSSTIVRRRWWSWHLMHPEQEAFVHPTRRVHPPQFHTLPPCPPAPASGG